MSQKPIALSLLVSAVALSGCSLWGSAQVVPEPAPDAALVEPAPQENYAKPQMSELVERTSPSSGLQLGAFGRPEGASQTLLRLQQQYPIVFENRTPIIRAIERDSTTLYRVILGPYSDAQIAQAFCKLLKQNGEVCFVTQFDRVDLRVDLIANTKDEK